MRGLFEHFKLTLALNFRNRQALVYGYLVPIFFLVAFGSIYRNSTPPLLGQLGQLLVISVMGGACFGMPTAMVAERERGIWRRFRLLPVATGSLVISTMAARFLIVLSAAVIQIFLARLMYGMPLPALPGQMTAAFAVVTFAFLGMGLVIAMLADAVPAVQALGQMIFLPMIIIGGVGVPLEALPVWARHVAGFLPGKYAVAALQACTSATGLSGVAFDVVALLVIGTAACIAGAMMFRWDAQERADPRKGGWVMLALAVWASVGVVGEITGRAELPARSAVTTQQPARPPETGTASSTTTSMPADISPDAGWRAMTRAEIEGITFKDLPEDNSTVTPVAANLDSLDEPGQKRMTEFRAQLADWGPGKDPSLARRVRNLLDVASIADIVIDPYEGAVAYVIFERIRTEARQEELEKVLAWITLHPADEHAITKVPELGISGTRDGARVREIQDRVEVYAVKLLGRLRGKIK